MRFLFTYQLHNHLIQILFKSMPRSCIMMNRSSIFSNQTNLRIIIYRTKIFFRIYHNTSYLLNFISIFQSILTQHLGCIRDYCLQIITTISSNKMQCRIHIQYLLVEAVAGVYPKAVAGGDCRSASASRPVFLTSHKWATSYYII